MPKSKLFSDFLKNCFKDNPELQDGFYEELFKLEIGNEIRVLRHERGMSQKELAKATKTAQSTIARLEDADNFSYSLKTLSKIAIALGMELQITFKDRRYKTEGSNLMKIKLVHVQEKARELDLSIPETDSDNLASVA